MPPTSSSLSPRPLTLAMRSAPFQESVIREMTRLGDATGSINLSQGLPDYDSPDVVLHTAARAILDGSNQYSFPFGLAEFREAIARKYSRDNQINADPETSITVTCGVSEAMMSAILALTDPGDEVIILEPWYENYLPDCRMAGVIPRFVPLREPDYTFDTRELRAAFNSRTRLVLINTPHNPTGRVFTRSELGEIARLCQEFGVIAVTDEIYEYILYGGREHTSIASLPGMEDRAVTLSGLGKTYSLTGWRVGWSVAHPSLTGLIRKVHDYLTICAPTPLQVGGVAALDLPSDFYDSLKEEYARRKEILLDGLRATGFTFLEPEGAYYVMADFGGLQADLADYQQPGWSTDRTFAEWIAREVGVAIVPGSSFYESKTLGASRVRFNFAKRPETLLEAARRLQAWQSKSHQQP